jgi:hypothetical protein
MTSVFHNPVIPAVHPSTVQLRITKNDGFEIIPQTQFFSCHKSLCKKCLAEKLSLPTVANSPGNLANSFCGIRLAHFAAILENACPGLQGMRLPP